MDNKRIVVKIGTSSLTYENGRLRFDRIERLVREISDLVNEGHQIILVSSGAVGAGLSRLGLTKRPATIPEKQAVAAVGQGLLMQIYSKFFSEYCHVCAQVLLTAEDLQQRKRYLNCRNTFETLLRLNVIPIVNENDSVAVDEIKFGDNDTLSALVANLVSADLLVVLSDIDGVYNKNPKEDPTAELIPVIEEIDEQIMSLAGDAGSLGTGGMVTKFHAAQIAQSSGIPMIITNSSIPNVIRKAVHGEGVGTLFLPDSVAMPSRKRWMAFYTHPHGEIIIDQGAVAALQAGKSLLPAGIVGCKGNFTAGDLVKICDQSGREIAKGLTNYSAKEIEIIKGKVSAEIDSLPVQHLYDEVIHRDNLVMTNNIVKGRSSWKLLEKHN
ncbi:MAG: glutamate 5-kinase [Firmicutes bacterium]|nr:glutamate 5-kinase [Bacillota bacterium]